MSLIETKELAKRLRVSIGTVRTWTRARQIPHIRISAKVVRYDFEAVVSALSVKQKGGDK